MACFVVKTVSVSIQANAFPKLTALTDSKGFAPHMAMRTTLNAPANKTENNYILFMHNLILKRKQLEWLADTMIIINDFDLASKYKNKSKISEKEHFEIGLGIYFLLRQPIALVLQFLIYDSNASRN